MPSVLYCDPEELGREQRLYKATILADESPLEFEDGHAIVYDEDAADVLVRRSPVEYASDHPDGDPGYFDAELEDGESGAESDTCQVVKSNGEVCGRDRPCQYHD